MNLKNIIVEEIKSYENYVSWSDLEEDVKTDIIENIYHNSTYLENNWNIWSFKDIIEDLINPPKFKVQYKDVNILYEELIQIGWGISEINLKRLMNILKHKELNPIILNNGKFFDGGHRLTAYKKLNKKLIPTIDIGKMMNFNWEKFLEN